MTKQKLKTCVDVYNTIYDEQILTLIRRGKYLVLINNNTKEEIWTQCEIEKYLKTNCGFVNIKIKNK